jgi:hypothetical protein
LAIAAGANAQQDMASERKSLRGEIQSYDYLDLSETRLPHLNVGEFSPHDDRL